MFSENHPYEGQEITAFNSNALFHKKKQYSIRLHGNTIGKFCTFFLSIFFWFYFTRKVKIDRKIKREESNDENTTGKQEGYSSFIDDRPTRNITTFQKARLSGNPFYAPLPRYNQGMAMDSKSGNLYLFGGSTTSKNEISRKTTILNDMHCYNRQTYQWEKVIDQKEVTPRTNFTMICLHPYLVAFGGTTIEEKHSNDLMFMNVGKSSSCVWNDIKGRQTPCLNWPIPRINHAMCEYKNKSIILFGGESNKGDLLNDLWLLDVQKISEYLQGPKPMDQHDKLWSRLQPDGNYHPQKRTRHSICSIDSFLYLLGGHDIMQKSQIEVYDFKTNVWMLEVTCGDEPPSASIASIHAIPKTQKIITVCQGSSSTRSDNVFNRIDVLDVSSKPYCWGELQLEWCGDWTLVPGTGRIDFASAFDLETGILFTYGGKSEDHGDEIDKKDYCDGNNDEFFQFRGDNSCDLSIHNNLIMADLKALVGYKP